MIHKMLRSCRGSLVVLVSLVSLSPFGGLGGCGSGSDDTSSGGTGSSGGDTGTATAVTVNSLTDIPSLNISDYYTAATNLSLSSALVAGKNKSTSVGESCTEFCYTRQCLMETLRHSKEIELFLCIGRKIKEIASFDIPSSGCVYGSVIPPSFLKESDDDRAKIRLCRTGDQVTFHLCDSRSGTDTLHEEIILNNSSTGTATATVTNAFSDMGCDDRGQMSISFNGGPDDIGNPNFAATFNANYNGCFGSGTINYSLSGGTPPTNTLAFNFNAGGEGEETFGSFTACGQAEWTAGANGCFKANASGTFPAMRPSEVPLSEIPGCDQVAASSPTALCPNDNFDPDNLDRALIVCPFEATSGTSCSFTFNNLECCSISGTTLATQTGEMIAEGSTNYPTALASEVTSRACPTQTTTISFVDSWNCQADAGGFTTINLGVAGLNFQECMAIKTDLESSTPESNCESQETADEAGNLKEEMESSESCSSNSDCTGEEVCSIPPEESTGFCVERPSSCTSDDDCGDDEVCIAHPDFGNICGPQFTCTLDDECPTGATCNSVTGLCEFEE